MFLFFKDWNMSVTISFPSLAEECMCGTQDENIIMPRFGRKTETKPGQQKQSRQQKLRNYVPVESLFQSI